MLRIPETAQILQRYATNSRKPPKLSKFSLLRLEDMLLIPFC